jgi:hypothetical protein
MTEPATIHTPDPHAAQDVFDPSGPEPGPRLKPTATAWELIRCPGCGREHVRRSSAVLVLSCPRCGRQPEAFALEVAERLQLSPLGRVGARVVGREFWVPRDGG